jgi:hypothetical protein
MLLGQRKTNRFIEIMITKPGPNPDRTEEKEMSKSKIADEEIKKYINEGKSNYQIYKETGVNYARTDKLRKEYGNLLPDPERPAGQKMEPIPAVPPEHAETVKPFPFEPKDDVIYGGLMHRVRSVGQTRMILCRNADLKGVTIMLGDYNAGRADVRKVGEKPPIKTAGEDVALKRRRQDEEPETPAKPPVTIFERVAARKADRKPDAEKTVEDLFARNEQASCGMSEAVADAYGLPAQPMDLAHIDLEMDDMTEPMGPFKDIDYTDSEWGGAEKEISDTVLSRREYLDKIDQLLDLMISDCKDPEMAYQVRKLACFTLITGIEGEIAAKYPAEVTAHER